MQAHNSRGIAPAQILQTWRAGGATALRGQGFDVDEAIPALTRVRPTLIILTPSIVHDMAASLAARPGVNVDSAKAIQFGGDTVTRGLMERCPELFPRRGCVFTMA